MVLNVVYSQKVVKVLKYAKKKSLSNKKGLIIILAQKLT